MRVYSMYLITERIFQKYFRHKNQNIHRSIYAQHFFGGAASPLTVLITSCAWLPKIQMATRGNQHFLGP